MDLSVRGDGNGAWLVPVDAEGLLTQGRRFPLRYPATVDWEGSREVFVGSGQAAADAVASGTYVAVFDPERLELTGVRPGAGTLTVTAGSLTETVPVEVGAWPAAAALAALPVFGVAVAAIRRGAGRSRVTLAGLGAVGAPESARLRYGAGVPRRGVPRRSARPLRGGRGLG